MVKTETRERRKFERAERVLSIEFRLVSQAKSRRDHSWRVAMTSDISRGGVSFYTDARLKEGDRIEMKIVMSGMIEIYSGHAKVTRTEKRPSAVYSLVAVVLIPETTKKNRLTHGGVC